MRLRRLQFKSLVRAQWLRLGFGLIFELSPPALASKSSFKSRGWAQSRLCEFNFANNVSHTASRWQRATSSTRLNETLNWAYKINFFCNRLLESEWNSLWKARFAVVDKQEMRRLRWWKAEVWSRPVFAKGQNEFRAENSLLRWPKQSDISAGPRGHLWITHR